MANHHPSSPADATDSDPVEPKNPTVLEIDEWGLRRGRDLVAESERLRRTGSDEFAAADFFAVAFEPAPKLLASCADTQSSRRVCRRLDSVAYDRRTSEVPGCGFNRPSSGTDRHRHRRAGCRRVAPAVTRSAGPVVSQFAVFVAGLCEAGPGSQTPATTKLRHYPLVAVATRWSGRSYRRRGADERTGAGRRPSRSRCTRRSGRCRRCPHGQIGSGRHNRLMSDCHRNSRLLARKQTADGPDHLEGRSTVNRPSGLACARKRISRCSPFFRASQGGAAQWRAAGALVFFRLCLVNRKWLSLSLIWYEAT